MSKKTDSAGGKSGLAVKLLLAATGYSLIAAAFAPDPETAPTAWALIFLGLGCIALYAFYRGIRILAGSSVFVSIVSALAVSSLLGMAGLLLAPQITSLVSGQSIALADGDQTGPAHFAGATAANTTASDLDALMEDW